MKKYTLFFFVLLMLLTVGCSNIKEDATYNTAYINKIDEIEEENENGEITYDLIYLNDDDIPELVAGNNGCYVSVYTYSDNNLYAIMDHYSYGVMGNNGYEYIPRQNVIRNYNEDFAGLVNYVSFKKINENYEFESYYEEPITRWLRSDVNGDLGLDESEMDAEEEIHYYYGVNEITDEEYENYMINGEYNVISGSLSAKEIKEKLNAL